MASAAQPSSAPAAQEPPAQAAVAAQEPRASAIAAEGPPSPVAALGGLGSSSSKRKIEPSGGPASSRTHSMERDGSRHKAAGGVGDAPPLARATSGRFKAVGNLVLAMRRFQASLNPTYTYGKTASGTPSRSLSTSKEVGADAGGDEAATHASSGGAPKHYGFDSHGHRAQLIFTKLPSPAE